jgi:hypothetical protein
MTIKSFLTFTCWMLLASALLIHPASADPNGLPQGIDPALLSGSEGTSGVISVNAPPQPVDPGRTRFLPPQPEGVIHLNAPSQPRRRTGALELAKKDCTPGTPGCPPNSMGLQRTQMRMDVPRFAMPGGLGGGAARIR